MKQEDRIIFTREMKRDYTILLPQMLPVHFEMLSAIFREYGYKTEVLKNEGKSVASCGLKYVHNDTCYPALLVIGQFIEALQSGKYYTDRVALMLTQTGGGCRASNYVALLRKALKKAGLGHVPVISLNFSGLEKNPGFKITAPMLIKLLYAIIYGDLIMLLRNHCRAHEKQAGQSDRVAAEWTAKLAKELADGHLAYSRVKKNYKKLLDAFGNIPLDSEEKPKVGIVGEIFVKFSPLGNNNLEAFLISEGAEPVMPGLLDFCLYCVYNNIVDYKLYNMNRSTVFIWRTVYKLLISRQKDLISAIEDDGRFKPLGCFDNTKELVRGYINHGAKMGEGWLLCAEMLELYENGVKNIVCAQPFGCLPNHIMGKGMMKPLKEKNPDINIVAIDYDPGATKINQENRIKLMLANAAEKKHSTAENKTDNEKEKILTYSGEKT
jgi:predicted nucleotide-binding protein (sugar kinase/HSP70/actin superfamily)